ncbi:MAG: hypothetical protein K2X11_22005, partial [Acetobacteraceae bacterium]|nr:hypothetical protein [Acetobacteraceae bacterium]
ELRLDLPLVACALAALLRAAGPDARLEVEADGSFRLTGWPDAPDSVPLRQAAALADAHGGALARDGAVLRLRFG